MAGDWIQMRVSIASDPKVTAMADFLAEQRAFMDWLSDPVRRHCDVTAYEHVTRDVTVRVTVSGLLLVWGAANECGKVDGEDLVLHFATLETLDQLAGVPCFGEAMAFVEWVEPGENGGGKPLIRFPKFMERNVPAEERARSANALRQQRYRDRKRNVTDDVTRDVTVTHKEEKRTKKSPVVPLNLPAGVTDADWQSFRDHRAANRKRLTPRAEQLACAKLHALAAKGFDPKKLLEHAIEAGWATFYEREECRTAPAARMVELGNCPCGAPATLKVGGKPRCAAHVRGLEVAA